MKIFFLVSLFLCYNIPYFLGTIYKFLFPHRIDEGQESGSWPFKSKEFA